MSDPRVPEDKAKEAQLPDDLDQNPEAGRPGDDRIPRGSEDARLLAGAEAGEAGVETDDAGTND